MLPLIPAILLLLLHGPSNFERFPQDARLPETWNTLHRASIGDISDEAMWAHLLAIASGQVAATEKPAPKADAELLQPIGSLDHLWTAPRLAEALQDCRRSRDGPDSNA